MGALLLALLNLHPTMYLLILFALLLFFYAASVFTSHYVSINSLLNIFKQLTTCDLHPTMYLLIPLLPSLLHPVSCNLHPTMYLLILVCVIFVHDSQIIYIPLCIY